MNTDHSDEAFYHPDYIGKASDRIDQNYVSFMFIFLQSLKFQIVFLHWYGDILMEDHLTSAKPPTIYKITAGAVISSAVLFILAWSILQP